MTPTLSLIPFCAQERFGEPQPGRMLRKTTVAATLDVYQLTFKLPRINN